MVEYSNPRVPDRINNSETRPLREFFWLTGVVLALLMVGLVGVGLVVQWLAERVPFEYERGLAEPFAETFVEDQADADPRIEVYLQALADRLAPRMGLDPEMSVRVHYSGDDTVNAMATLGGHLILYRGLIMRMGSENALAMVMAHEIAHVHHRDPIVSIGRGVALVSALGALTGVSSSQIASQFVGEAGVLTNLRFSRQQETNADSAGLRAVAALYGHVAGSLDLYRAVAGDGRSSSGIALDLFETHPDAARRVQRLQALAAEQGWTFEGETTPLPEWLPHAIHDSQMPLE